MSPKTDSKTLIAALTTISGIFGNTYSENGLSLALWLMSINSFLNARRPCDALLTDPDLVIEAAKDYMRGPVHA